MLCSVSNLEQFRSLHDNSVFYDSIYFIHFLVFRKHKNEANQVCVIADQRNIKCAIHDDKTACSCYAMHAILESINNVTLSVPVSESVYL